MGGPPDRDDSKALSVSELLALHPWPEPWGKHKRLEWFWHQDLSGDPETVWRLMSDTSRVNRALGVSEMKFEEKDGKRWGSSRNGGVRHEWVEVPWNWVAGQWLDSVRVYERGFSRAVYAVQRFEPIATGTRVYLYFGAVPRSAIGSTALKIGFPSLVKAYKKVLPAMMAQLDRLRPEVLLLPAPELEPDARARLDAICAQLAKDGLPEPAIRALADWVRTGDEQDLARIQIRERARAWKLPEDDVLRTALHATRAGMLELSWDVVCPHCRGVREEASNLGGVPASASCEVCKLDFGTGDPETVEITFRVHPSIRAVPTRLFCSAEPATKDHIRVQYAVAAGGTAVVTPGLEPGRYRMRTIGDPAVRYLDVDGAAAGGQPRIDWRAGTDAAPVAAGPRPTIALANPGDEPRTFVVETVQWKDDALRAGHLLSFQDFRDLFAEDYVSADVQLGVGEQTLLFTDMVGSTSFYASRGDPSAFVEVKRHFDEVFAIVVKHRGAVVKTIGDACMGAFTSPLDAVRASREIHDTFSPSRTDTPIRLRISLNTGPCIAVRLNANMDYFGGTVNIAAKLQSLAEAWQVAMSEATYAAPGVAAYLAEQGATLEDLTYTSPALPAPVAVKRWTVHSS
jgi:class 3 adenylate cyclase